MVWVGPRELRRLRGEGRSQGPVAACHVGLGQGGGSWATRSRRLTGGPRESLPLHSKYYWRLETRGNPGQRSAGLVMRGESAEAKDSRALSSDAGARPRAPGPLPCGWR